MGRGDLFDYLISKRTISMSSHQEENVYLHDLNLGEDRAVTKGTFVLPYIVKRLCEVHINLEPGLQFKHY